MAWPNSNSIQKISYHLEGVNIAYQLKGPCAAADIRDHATERMQTAFSKNAAVHKKDVQRLAKELEEACFGRAKTGGNPR